MWGRSLSQRPRWVSPWRHRQHIAGLTNKHARSLSHLRARQPRIFKSCRRAYATVACPHSPLLQLWSCLLIHNQYCTWITIIHFPPLDSLTEHCSQLAKTSASLKLMGLRRNLIEDYGPAQSSLILEQRPGMFYITNTPLILQCTNILYACVSVKDEGRGHSWWLENLLPCVCINSQVEVNRLC